MSKVLIGSGKINLGATPEVDESAMGRTTVMTGATAWIDWLLMICATLSQSQGASEAKSSGMTGTTLPIISGLDTIAIFSMIAPACMNAYRREMKMDKCAKNSIVRDTDGALSHGVDPDTSGSGDMFCGVELWLAYEAPDSSVRWKRGPKGSDTFEPCTPLSPSVDVEVTSAIRQMADYWNDVTVSSGQAIISCGTDATNRCEDVNISAFFTTMHRLCSHLDVLKEFVPSTTTALIVGGLKAAKQATVGLVHDAAVVAGQVAAEGMNIAGQAAGAGVAGAAKGFGDQIGITGLAVAAIGIYVALHV